MPPRDPRAFLQDIISACTNIRALARGVTFEQYSTNLEKRSAIERQLMNAGEAASQLRQRHRPIASRLADIDRIVAFRNILVHGYFALRNDVVWDIIQIEVPRLRADAEDALEALGP
jgi:uncharacterized protein with HEPN domain